jgi:two-component system, cell cycle response regulator
MRMAQALMNVLIADDDPVSRRLLEVSLSREGYPVSVAANGAEALRLLELPDGPRLTVLDWMMPEVDGVDVCRIIRRSPREAYVYIILLTARGHQAEVIQGLEAGADDYVIKPFDLHELKARVRAGMRILELQEQLVIAREQSRVQATHDSLTGLLNHVAILTELERELARSFREGNPVAVLMADIDYFKGVNDTFGHPAGDVVLHETARKMMSLVRPYDAVGRYGGEEFVAVLPGCDLDAAVKRADSIREFVCGQPVLVADVSIPITLSIGVVVAWEDARPGQLLQAADEALYVAKNAGRNRVAAAPRVNITSIP